MKEIEHAGRHGPTPILGPDGAPLPRPRDLTREIAAPTLAGVRALNAQVIAAGLGPERLATILRQAIDGDHRAYLQLAEDMEERDLHYAAVLGVRKRGLSGIRAIVEEPEDTKVEERVMHAVTALVRRPAFRGLVSDLLDAIGKGYSVAEIIWAERDGLWQPVEYRHRDPRWFTFDGLSRTSLRLATDATLDGEPLPEGKFIRHLPRLKTGLPVRGGLARLAAWGYLFKSFSLRNWAQFCEVHGMPLRVGKYHAGATADERRALLRAVTQIAADAGAIIPDGMLIEFVEAKASGLSPYEGLARYCDEQLSKAVLGQTMTSDNGSSNSQATIHNEIRIELLEDDAAQLAATINRDLIAWFVALNFGAETPRPEVIFPVQKPEDVTAVSTALEKLVPLGLRIKASEVREKLGFSAPDEGDEVLEPPRAPQPQEAPDENKPPGEQKPPASPAARNSRLRCDPVATNSAQTIDDDLDEIVRAGAEDWRGALTPLVEAIRAAAARATSFEEFRIELDRLSPDMSALERELLAAHLKARGLSADG